MASTAAAMIAKAASQIGVREGRDPNGNWNNAVKYNDWYAEEIKNEAFRRVAWCDIFISWCAVFSGNGDIIPKCAYVPYRLSYYRNLKRTGMSWPPEPGDLGMVMRGGSAQHIFLVEKVIGTSGTITVQTIEGNTNTSGSSQGDGVYRLQRKDWSTNTGLIFARPDYAPEIVRVPSGGQSAPIPKPASKPAPKPASKPAPKSTGFVPLKGQTGAYLHLLRPGVQNSTSVYFYQLALRKYLGAATAAKLNPAGATGNYGSETIAMTKAAYRKYGTSPNATWPGPKLLGKIGVKILR